MALKIGFYLTSLTLVSFVYGSLVDCNILKLSGFREMDGDYTRDTNSSKEIKFYDDSNIFVHERKRECFWYVNEDRREYPCYVSSDCGYSWEYISNTTSESIYTTMSCSSPTNWLGMFLLVSIIVLLIFYFNLEPISSVCTDLV